MQELEHRFLAFRLLFFAAFGGSVCAAAGLFFFLVAYVSGIKLPVSFFLIKTAIFGAIFGIVLGLMFYAIDRITASWEKWGGI